MDNKKVCSNVFQDRGNTSNPVLSKKSKTISPAKHWCFTLNNWTEEEYCSIVSTINTKSIYGIIGSEIGSLGETPHLQGYIHFKSKVRAKSAHHNSRIHWEKCKGNKKQNIEYCSKECVKYVFPKPYTIDISLNKWENGIIDIIAKEPNQRTINWFWEETGGVGKTTFQKWVFLNYQKVVVLGGKGGDMKNGVVQYLKNTQSLPEIILINVPRTMLDYISYTGIEEIKDMFFYSGKYEGGMICGKSPHVLIFANSPPNKDRMSKDRWNVKHLKEWELD